METRPDEEPKLKRSLMTMPIGDMLTTAAGTRTVYVSLYEGLPDKRVAIKTPSGKIFFEECTKGRIFIFDEGASFGTAKDRNQCPESIDVIVAQLYYE